MSSAVDQPIINDPFKEPASYYVFEEGQPRREQGRRPAGYYMAPRTRSRTGAIAAEEFVQLEMVKIKQRMRNQAKNEHKE